MINAINNTRLDIDFDKVSKSQGAKKLTKAQELKMKIDSGEYRIDVEKTSQKMAEYFS